MDCHLSRMRKFTAWMKKKISAIASLVRPWAVPGNGQDMSLIPIQLPL